MSNIQKINIYQYATYILYISSQSNNIDTFYEDFFKQIGFEVNNKDFIYLNNSIYSSAHVSILSIIGINFFPISVRLYSTLKGTSLKTVLEII